MKKFVLPIERLKFIPIYATSVPTSQRSLWATTKTYQLMAYRDVSVFIVRIILNT